MAFLILFFLLGLASGMDMDAEHLFKLMIGVGIATFPIWATILMTFGGQHGH